MLVQTAVIVGAMLALLTLISTLGGSMIVREQFEADDPADAGDEGKQGAVTGEVIRGPREPPAGDHPIDDVGAEFPDQDQGAPPPARRPEEPGEGPADGQPPAIEPFQGDMYASY